MAEVSDNRQPLSKNQLGIAVVVLVVVIAVALGLYFLLKGSSKHHKNNTPAVAARIGPTTMSAAQLKVFARTIKTPFYWAGPRAGYRYEFTRATNGYLYVRYLPRGVPNGVKSAKYLIVTTYPFINALAALKKQATGNGINGPGHSLVYVNPQDPHSVYVAFPGVDYEIEVYDPSAPIAAATAQSRKLQAVHG